ncbi:hypothetical protein [Liquorilactobacillus mali]|uniref:hypothetical protein n=1 Tax=Liquorilactobacillus mali TaxID=1618 RepID=UPI00024918EA|nr:hypothetical protein [Liquorilactobacillus mali]EJF00069.1 hypothetical protein LMA_04326 [Liquorilactobacillus mali KCTC 3596 = DSM 20444]MDC7953558.1 hypothetical protein [Liquorilactobacillus mali]MDV7758309.1 hypothetical protein [Liquorilactobacillus mali]QFQ74485.1 hypothetical protein LM596_04855 [Liquorilactobacillus mali]
MISTIISFFIFLLGILLLFIGLYLLKHKNEPFMLFHPEKHKDLRIIIQITGTLLLILAFLTFVSLILNNQIFLSVILILDVAIIPILPILMLSYIEK